MTSVEWLTLVVSTVSLVVAAVSLVCTRKVAQEQLRLEAITAELSRKQLEQLNAREAAEVIPQLDVSILRKQGDDRLVVANRGIATAFNVKCSLVDPAERLIYREQDLLPHPEIRTGNNIELGLVLHDGCPPFHVHVTFDDGEGHPHSDDFHLAP